MRSLLSSSVALFAPATLLELPGALGSFALLSRFVVATLSFSRRLRRVSRSGRRFGASLSDVSVVWWWWRCMRRYWRPLS